MSADTPLIAIDHVGKRFPGWQRMVDKAIQIWTFSPDSIDVTQVSVQYQQHFTTNYYGFRTVRLER